MVHCYMKKIYIIFLIVFLFIVHNYYGVPSLIGAEDNKTIDEPQFTKRGFPKILADDQWTSQVIYDTVGACYQGTIRWVILSNPSLLGQMPSPIAQRQMVEHCFCVMDKIRKENKLEDYFKKVSNPEWTGNLFMLKAMECVAEYETLPSFFMKMPGDNETKQLPKIKTPPEEINPDNSPSTKDEESLPDQQKEFKEEPPLIFQG